MNTRFYSSEQEKYIAKLLGAKQVANSGSTPFNKGDVILDDKLLIECKTVIKESKSFNVKKEWFEKLKQEAFGMGINANRYALAFNFGGGAEENFFIVNEKFFKEIVNLLGE